MLDIYQSIEYVMPQSILSEVNHDSCFVHLFLQIHMEDTTYFPLCHEIISYTSFPIINFYYLIIASFIAFFFFILSYLSYPWWSSSVEVDLPLFEALSFVMVSLTLGDSDSCLLNCHHLFFGTSLILLLFWEVVQDLSYNSNAPVSWLEIFHKSYA